MQCCLHKLFGVALVLCCLTLATPVLACPDCTAARRARASLLADPHAGLYFLAIVLPFVVIGALSVWLARKGGVALKPSEDHES